MTELTVATWNVEWRMPGLADAGLIRERLDAVRADIVCLTEAFAGLLAGDGHVIESTPDYGYPIVEGRRKVLLWSREPWEAVDTTGHPDLPPGRFVAGRTMTPAGAVAVIGVCIPWREAHVRSGTRDRALWQDHLAYLDGLKKVLAGRSEPTLVIGDFNQRIPRQYSPPHVFEALERTLEGFRVATAGAIGPIGKAAIDHIGHSEELEPLDMASLSNIAAGGRQISDHFGVVVRLRRTGWAQTPAACANNSDQRGGNQNETSGHHRGTAVGRLRLDHPQQGPV